MPGAPVASKPAKKAVRKPAKKKPARNLRRQEAGERPPESRQEAGRRAKAARKPAKKAARNRRRRSWRGSGQGRWEGEEGQKSSQKAKKKRSRFLARAISGPGTLQCADSGPLCDPSAHRMFQPSFRPLHALDVRASSFVSHLARRHAALAADRSMRAALRMIIAQFSCPADA
jgi:hypothetical protein